MFLPFVKRRRTGSRPRTGAHTKPPPWVRRLRWWRLLDKIAVVVVLGPLAALLAWCCGLLLWHLYFLLFTRTS